jgi:hypothetical protein
MSFHHLDPLRRHLLSLATTRPPEPWRKLGTIAVGGLHSIGFDRESELLLVASASGRGLIDCDSGQKIARDNSESAYPNRFLELQGIGPLASTTLRMSGLDGGGLPLNTNDGWSVESVSLAWPMQELVLLQPWASLYDTLSGKPDRFHKIAREDGLRAFGFSYSGRSLVVATSSEIAIFNRNLT